MKEYEAYVFSLSALQCTGQRVSRMPMAACIDAAMRKQNCWYEMNKEVDRVTELDCVNYFKAARNFDAEATPEWTRQWKD